MKRHFLSIIESATKAPSGHNTQPWKFEVDHDRIMILPDYTRALPVVDTDNHALFISLGCALENLVISAEHYGYEALVQLHPGNEACIDVELKEAIESEDNKLFEQIAIRQSCRNKYNGKPIPAKDLEMLKDATIQEDVQCSIITGHQEIEQVIRLVKEGCVIQFSNKAFVDELVHWMRFNKSHATQTLDGLYSAASGYPSVPEWFGKLIMGITVSSQKEANKCEQLIRSSSALVVFIAKRNDQKAWINVGRSFERFALTATALNIHAAHENMPCEETEVRKKLARLLRLKEEEQPLLLLRIGYSEKMPFSYRRPVSAVVVEQSKKPVS